MKLKIAFRIDISNKIGTGHYYRMNALADAFIIIGHQCDFFKTEDEPVDYSGYDIIIIDTYEVNDDYIKKINTPEKLIVCYDDNALYTYDCDVLINANIYAHELKFRFGAKKPKLLLGGKYALLRNEFQKAAPVKIQEKANNVFICFGGADTQNMTPKIINALKNIENIYLHVVLGSYTKNDEEVLNESGENVIIYKNPDKISKVMEKCDIAVTASGTMTYELASIGLPGIVITQADNQKLISEYLDEHNIAIVAGDYKAVNYDILADEVKLLLNDYKKRNDLSKKMFKQVNKHGAKNAAEKIITIFHKKEEYVR